jgi:hypothetical protein
MMHLTHFETRSIPSPILSFRNGAAREEPGDAAWRYMVKENEHRPFGRRESG